jgi:hypothetical protein
MLLKLFGKWNDLYVNLLIRTIRGLIMKYRDVITFFIALPLLLSFAYTIGVDNNIWYIPLILFIIFIILIYKLWIED